MEKKKEFHFIPGQAVQVGTPLDRYLPPHRRGAAGQWLIKNIPKDGWLLDPFGASPDMAIEAAQKGYGIIVSANNPIIRFILEMRCHPPSHSEFQAAIATLASSLVGRERLEPHVKSIYDTYCEGCNAKIQASAYLWKKEEEVPFGKVYSCPHCGESGEFPTTLFDKEKATRFSQNILHKTRALEKVTPLHDPDRHHVLEALGVYLPRSIYVLVTIMNKLGSFHQDDNSLRILNSLLLLAFDRSNTMWLYPKARQRPKQLIMPPQFREHNIWMALESAIDLWTNFKAHIPLTIYPDLPSETGGVCIFKGRIKELVDVLPNLDIRAILTSFPRPNQAFWTLSALWSGWLWGHEALEHYKSVLRRRRYDWGWHGSAINAALKVLIENLQSATPFWGTIDELEPGFLSAVTIGSLVPNMHLEGIALRSEDGQAQLFWQKKKIEESPAKAISSVEDEIRNGVKTYLEEERGEPSPYIYLHAAGLRALANHPFQGEDRSIGEFLSTVQSSFSRTLTYRNGFLRFKGSGKSIEIGDWWIRDYQGKVLPVSDRVEMEVVNCLLKYPKSTFYTLDQRICENTPSLAPPETELIQVCLESYGILDPSEQRFWSIQDRDKPATRRKDIQVIAGMLEEIGTRLEYQTVSYEKPQKRIDWIDKSGGTPYTFYISASGVLGRYLLEPETKGKKSIIVVPGSRANLVAYKLRTNPHLNLVFGQDWEFIKYRHIRQLVERSNLNQSNLDEQLSLDPLTYTKPQIRLL
jgi:hypothetical protein